MLNLYHDTVVMKAKKTKIILAAILVTAVVALLVTCPGRKAHRVAIIDAIGNAIVAKANLNLLGDAAKSFKDANYAFYNTAVDPRLKVMGYGLFSIGYITDGENRERVSFGILGHVCVKDKENIYRKIPMLAEPVPVSPEKSPENQ